MKRNKIGLRSVNKTVGCFDPSIRTSYSVSVYIIAVHFLIRVESRNSASVNSREFADIRFFLFVPLCDCNNAAPMPKFEASHAHCIEGLQDVTCDKFFDARRLSLTFLMHLY